MYASDRYKAHYTDLLYDGLPEIAVGIFVDDMYRYVPSNRCTLVSRASNGLSGGIIPLRNCYSAEVS